jgi:uncharacterized protein (DUF433 family)
VDTGVTTDFSLLETVVWALSRVDTESSDAASSAFALVLDRLDRTRAIEDYDRIPDAVGHLPFDRLGDDRTVIAANLALAHDMYEVVAPLAHLVRAGHVQTILLASGLATHPGVPPVLKDLVIEHAEALGGPLRDLALSRLDPLHEPSTPAAIVDRGARWFDRSNAFPTVAPVVVVDPSAGPARDRWRLIGELHSAGVIVKRLPHEVWQEPTPGWLPRSALTVTAETTSRRGRWLATGGSLTRSMRRRVAEAAFAHIDASPFNLPPQPIGVERLESVATYEIFTAGAIPNSEVQFFADISHSTLSKAAKAFGELAPRPGLSLNYWAFSQLVALRAARYLARIAADQHKRVAIAELASEMLRLTQEHQEVPFGVTSDGSVVADRDGVLVNLKTGQQAMGDVVSLVDRIYEPIILSERTVPGLLRPTKLTRVHPGIAAGLPTIVGTRIPARAIGAALRDARNSKMADPYEAVLDAYPDLEDVDYVRDAENLDRRILATS